MVKPHFFFALTFWVCSISMAQSIAEPPKTACQEPARTVCINSCVSDLCRASCEQSYCGTEGPAWGPFAGAPAEAAPGSEPLDLTGFPDLNLTDVKCNYGLSDTMKDSIIPIYKENDLLSTYKIVFEAWGCQYVSY